MLIAIRQKFNGYIMGLTSVLAGQPFFVFGRNRQDDVKPGTCPLVISAEASVAVKFTIGGGAFYRHRWQEGCFVGAKSEPLGNEKGRM